MSLGRCFAQSVPQLFRSSVASRVASSFARCQQQRRSPSVSVSFNSHQHRLQQASCFRIAQSALFHNSAATRGGGGDHHNNDEEEFADLVGGVWNPDDLLPSKIDLPAELAQAEARIKEVSLQLKKNLPVAPTAESLGATLEAKFKAARDSGKPAPTAKELRDWLEGVYRPLFTAASNVSLDFETPALKGRPPFNPVDFPSLKAGKFGTPDDLKNSLDTLFSSSIYQYMLYPELRGWKAGNTLGRELADYKSEHEFKKGNFAEAYSYSKEAGMLGESGIWQKYGYPLFGLGAVIAISKELFILNEEVVVMCEFILLVSLGYIFLREPATEYFSQEREAHLNFFREPLADVLESYTRGRENYEKLLAALKYMKAYNAYVHRVMESSLALAASNAKHHVAKQVNAALNLVYENERSFVQRLNQRFVEGFEKYAAAYFANAPAKLHSQLIENALDRLEKPTTKPMSSKVIETLYKEYLKKAKQNMEAAIKDPNADKDLSAMINDLCSKSTVLLSFGPASQPAVSAQPSEYHEILKSI